MAERRPAVFALDEEPAVLAAVSRERPRHFGARGRTVFRMRLPMVAGRE